MEKKDQISAELRKLKKLFEDVPANKRDLCDGLIQNAAFMAVTLKELQTEVIANGAVISCQSGNGFDTIKDNPAQKAYTTMVSRYTDVINRLMQLLPDETQQKDELMDFLSK